MEPALAQFESENKTRIHIININVDSETGKLDKYPEVARDLQAKGGIPNTWIVDGKGKIVWSFLGGMSKGDLDKAAKPYLK